MQPPLVEIICIADKTKDYISSIELDMEIEPDEEAKAQLRAEHAQAKALVRNLNLLIVDVFKEFDQVLEKVMKASKKQTDFSISKDAVVSLTSLLSLSDADKKLIQSLGKALV